MASSTAAAARGNAGQSALEGQITRCRQELRTQVSFTPSLDGRRPTTRRSLTAHCEYSRLRGEPQWAAYVGSAANTALEARSSNCSTTEEGGDDPSGHVPNVGAGMVATRRSGCEELPSQARAPPFDGHAAHGYEEANGTETTPLDGGDAFLTTAHADDNDTTSDFTLDDVGFKKCPSLHPRVRGGAVVDFLSVGRRLCNSHIWSVSQRCGGGCSCAGRQN